MYAVVFETPTFSLPRSTTTLVLSCPFRTSIEPGFVASTPAGLKLSAHSPWRRSPHAAHELLAGALTAERVILLVGYLALRVRRLAPAGFERAVERLADLDGVSPWRRHPSGSHACLCRVGVWDIWGGRWGYWDKEDVGGGGPSGLWWLGVLSTARPRSDRGGRAACAS